LSWLLLAVLGIIWAAFLFPSHRRSPASSVEEFERKMSVLADAQNTSSAGRWVLMPRKGQRFLEPQDRGRVRARRRRRYVFTVLLEACALTLLMGLFPPFRKMLFGTAILVGLLAMYTVSLIRIRATEISQAQARRRAIKGSALAGTNGNGHSAWSDEIRQGGVRIVDEDVHVVVRSSEEIEREAILAAAAASRSGAD
jgi:hypothetical protein